MLKHILENSKNERILTRTLFFANRLVDECEIVLDEETDKLPKDGIRKTEIIEIYKNQIFDLLKTNQKTVENEDAKEQFSLLLSNF